MYPRLCKRPGLSLSGRDGACHVFMIISQAGPWWAGCLLWFEFLQWMLVPVEGPAGVSLALLLPGPVEGSEGVQGTPPTPPCCSGGGEGWREM